MGTTTSEDGAVTAQPNDEAGQDDGAMVITTDESGTPTMVPVGQATEPNAASQEQDETEETQEQAAEPTGEAQADTDAEVVAWAEKKGLKIDPTNPNEVKLARVNLENDRRFHEAQQTKVQPPELLDATEDPAVNAVVQRQNDTEMKMYVRDWFDANPGMKEHRSTLTQIANDRPYLTDMDDVAAHLYKDPSFVSKISSEGGRRALENLAQKQSAVPPQASASNTASYGSEGTITPQNVADLVDQNDQAWFEKNHEAISKALSN